jgi:hypothetical protein
MADLSAESPPDSKRRQPDRRGHRRRWIVAAAVGVALATIAFATYEARTATPDLAIESRHQVKLHVAYPCGPQFVRLDEYAYGGRIWWISSVDATASPPVNGILVITRPITGRQDGSDTAELDAGQTRFVLEGGVRFVLMSCPIR